MPGQLLTESEQALEKNSIASRGERHHAYKQGIMVQ